MTTATTTPNARAADVLDEAVASGLLTEWAEITDFRPGARLTLRRIDTDNRTLIVPLRNVRQALRRVSTHPPERLGITDAEARGILSGSLEAELCDLVVQIAAIGRVVYR